MASYPKTGSILDSTTHTALSTQVLIMVNNEPVGAIQSFQVNQRRSNKRVTEIGTDGTIEIVPESKTDISITISRIAFDGLSLPEGFARGYRNLQSQRIPFDIIVIDQFSGQGDDAIITTYHNCWFSSMDKQFQAESYIIVENASVDVEYVSEQRGGAAVAESQGVGGSRQVANIQRDVAEQAADSGSRRGALDFPGLISAAY